MKKTVAVITEKGRVSTSTFIGTKHALDNLDPFALCLERAAVVNYFKLHPRFCAMTPEETLAKIGNVAGRPDTHYASPRVSLEQAQAKLAEISRLVQEQLCAVIPQPDPDKFRTNPSMFDMLDTVRRKGYYKL
jgi:hypothetical protein